RGAEMTVKNGPPRDVEIQLGSEQIGRICIERGVYGLVVSLWFCAFDLSELGQRLCRQILQRYTQRAERNCGPWPNLGAASDEDDYHAGPAAAIIRRVAPDDRETCLTELLAVIYVNLVRASPSTRDLTDDEAYVYATAPRKVTAFIQEQSSP